MATKDSELIELVDTDLRVVDSALIQVRSVTKALEAARDTLKFVRAVLQQREKEVPHATRNV